MPSHDALRGEVLWEARRRKIESEYTLATSLVRGRLDLWTLRKMVVAAIDAGERVDFGELFTSS
jgi:hypothetical protein